VALARSLELADGECGDDQRGHGKYGDLGGWRCRMDGAVPIHWQMPDGIRGPRPV